MEVNLTAEMCLNYSLPVMVRLFSLDLLRSDICQKKQLAKQKNPNNMTSYFVSVPSHSSMPGLRK